MRLLLRLVERLCGESARRSIFEPLVADWQRERRETAAVVRTIVDLRWSFGFLAALIGCAARHATSAEGPLWRYGIVVFAVAIGVSIAAETLLIRFTATADYTWDLLLIAALRLTGLATLAAAMLPAMFLLRRNARATARTAAGYTALGSLLIALAVVAQPSLEDYVVSFSQSERMYQRALVRDRAGDYRYPGTVLRQLGYAGTTVEERRARYDQYLAMRANTIAKRAVRTPWQRLRRSTAPVMVIAFGGIGWALGGLLRPTLFRAAIWWLTAWLVSLMVEGRVSGVLGSRTLDRRGGCFPSCRAWPQRRC